MRRFDWSPSLILELIGNKSTKMLLPLSAQVTNRRPIFVQNQFIASFEEEQPVGKRIMLNVISMSWLQVWAKRQCVLIADVLFLVIP